MKAPLPTTPAEQRVLEYCKSYFKANDNLPPSRFIQRELGYASQTSAQKLLQSLLKKGRLSINQNGKYKFNAELTGGSASRPVTG